MAILLSKDTLAGGLEQLRALCAMLIILCIPRGRKALQLLGKKKETMDRLLSVS